MVAYLEMRTRTPRFYSKKKSGRRTRRCNLLENRIAFDHVLGYFLLLSCEPVNELECVHKRFGVRVIVQNLRKLPKRFLRGLVSVRATAPILPQNKDSRTAALTFRHPAFRGTIRCSFAGFQETFR